MTHYEADDVLDAELAIILADISADVEALLASFWADWAETDAELAIILADINADVEALLATPPGC